jgi:hypothetical protein
MNTYEDQDLYEVEVVRVEYRRYKVRVRAFDREDAEEQALLQYDHAKPDEVEMVEQYVEQIDWAGP